MPVLKNAKHELFAQALAKGKTQREAYIGAGYKYDEANAGRLTKNDGVAARVAELQGKVAAKVAVTVESLAAELEEARTAAVKSGQNSAAVQATLGKAKLFGLGVENRKVSGTMTVLTITPKHLDGLSEDDLAKLEAAYPVLQKLGLVGGDPSAADEAGG